MSTTEIQPVTLDSIEAIRSLVGHKVRIEGTYLAKDSRRKHALPVRRAYAEVGTIVRDERVEGLERYLLRKRQSGHVLYPDADIKVTRDYGVRP